MKTSIVETGIERPELQEWEQPFKSGLSFLLQVCMVAARHGFGPEAEGIVSAVEAVRPQHPSPKLARALVCLYQNKFTEAIDRLNDDLLASDPKNDMAQAFLAVALHMEGRLNECRMVLVKVLQTGTNEKALAVAKSVAGEIGMAV